MTTVWQIRCSAIFIVWGGKFYKQTKEKIPSVLGWEPTGMELFVLRMNGKLILVLKPVSTAKKIYCKTRQKHSDSRLLSFILKRRIMFLISSSLRATVVGGATDAIALLFAFVILIQRNLL
jgi:hypothetical protein